MKSVIFDLDGSLSLSKEAIDQEMAELICQLTLKFNVGIVSGASWDKFEEQILEKLTSNASLDHLFLFTESGANMYQFWGRYGWIPVYQKTLSQEDKDLIESTFKSLEHLYPKTEKSWGPKLQIRNSQVTYSALGQNAPFEYKAGWDPSFDKRKPLANALKKKLSGFDVNFAGKTSIDVTKKGFGKSNAIEEFSNRFRIPLTDITYVGDSIFKDGNGQFAVDMGLETVSVQDVDDTKDYIKKVLK
jgi:phosphomannomutase